MFALLDQAAARFGDRGAVYLGERQIISGPSCGTGLCGWPVRCAAVYQPGARIAVASENRPEIIELMFAVWAAGCVWCRSTTSCIRARWSRSSTMPARHRFSLRRRSPQSSHRSPTCRSRSSPARPTLTIQPPSRRRPGHRSGRAGVAVLHQRHHRQVQGRDAVAPQPDGDDGRPPRRLRLARRELQPDPRRADVARVRAVHPAVRAARRPPGDTGVGGLRA